MAELFTLEYLAAFLTLTAMEIVLGIDNVVFIAVLSERVEEPYRARTRKVGLLVAMFTRLGLLFAITWIMGLTAPLFSVLGWPVSGRDLILLAGGLFLIYKATHEIHDKLEGSQETLHEPRVASSQTSVIAQIVLLDLVFSIDSVITAVGMVRQEAETMWRPLTVMSAAIVVAVVVMMIFAGRVSRFIERHPTTKMLALSFLLLIGVMLVAEGLHQEIPKGYVYSAMAFSVFVELLQLRLTKKKQGGTPQAPADEEGESAPG